MTAVTSLQITSAGAFAKVRELLEAGVQDGVFPGAVLSVGRRGTVLFEEAVGSRNLRSEAGQPLDPMRRDTVFDIAAITGGLATTSLMMVLVQSKAVKLTDSVARYIQGFSILGKSKITVGQLLSHFSGLPHWHPFFEDLVRENSGARRGILTSRGARDFVVNWINRSALKNDPGEKQFYSDLGFILLGQLVETLTGLSLERAFQRLVAAPLGLKSTSFIDLSMIKRRGIHPVTELIAPTEDCSWRNRVLCGEVHDDNAWAMGGIAGHSGLFSSAQDLHLFASEMIRAFHGKSQWLTAETVKQFWNGPLAAGEGSWAYGWERPSEDNEMTEAGLSKTAVGQTGFTGCSLWIEPEKEIEIVLLTNRIHPSRSNKKIRAFRPSLHAAVLEAL